MAANDDKKLDYIQERLDTAVDRISDIRSSVESLRVSFEEHVHQDEDLKEEFTRMNSTLQENTVSLREHMRRTDLLEEYVKKVDARFSPLEMEQLRKKAVNTWLSAKLKLFAKVGGAVSAGGAIILALKHLIHFLVG